RGGGWRGRAADLLQADIEGGPVAASRAAARLLTLAFALPEGAE
ncbi:MAG: gene transfer agent family protein, partial [Pseudomonadota bacterium]|nr:gene transfer agent family protein [Pseudomonadota bacterium]